MGRADQLREIATLAFRGMNGKPLNKQELAAELRKRNYLTKRKDADDTRGVQRLVDAAGKFLLSRDADLAELEEHSILMGKEGPIFEKYPSLILAIASNPDEAAFRRSWKSSFNPVHPVFSTTHAAALFFSTILQLSQHPGLHELHVAISGGYPVFQTVNHMRPSLAPLCYFYSGAIVPSYNPGGSYIVGPETNTTLAWARSGLIYDRCHICSLPTPPVARSVDELQSDRVHKQAQKDLAAFAAEWNDQDGLAHNHLGKMNAYNVLLTSVEPITSTDNRPTNPASVDILAPFDVSSYAGAADLFEFYGIDADRLVKEGAVGAMNYSFFDRDGKDRENWRYCITPGFPNSLDFYRQGVLNGDLIIVVCSNPTALPGLRVALKTGLFNILITDLEIMNELMEDEPPLTESPASEPV